MSGYQKKCFFSLWRPIAQQIAQSRVLLDTKMEETLEVNVYETEEDRDERQELGSKQDGCMIFTDDGLCSLTVTESNVNYEAVVKENDDGIWKEEETAAKKNLNGV